MKNILITGTSSGIGAVMASYLTEKGYHVIGTSRKGADLKNTYKTLQLDVTDANSVNDCIREATALLGSIDVLINNAGAGISGAIEDTSIEEAKWQFETNYFGVVRMTQAILPQMRSRNNGIIINIGSILGLIGMPFQGHYCASKFALGGFTESLRYELLPYNVQVTNINPGDFKTNFSKNRSFIKNRSETYKTKFDIMRALVEKDEANGADPMMIAKLVEKLIQQKRKLKIRYTVANRDQIISMIQRKFIGVNLFEKGAKALWKI